MSTFQEILDFWFGTDEQNPMAKAAMWWKPDAALDEQIKQRFASEIHEAIQGKLDPWKASPEGTLAWIILLDQFSRNIFRNSHQAFSQDPLALTATLKAIERGDDQKLGAIHRWFLYMPLMHSEDPNIHRRSLEIYTRLAESAPDNFKEALKSAYDFAERHAKIIFRFGRYPHRNKILGRKSTPEEETFLLEPGSSF